MNTLYVITQKRAVLIENLKTHAYMFVMVYYIPPELTGKC